MALAICHPPKQCSTTPAAFDEPGDGEAALEVDDFGVVADVGVNVRVIAHRGDGVTIDGDGLGFGQAVVDGDDDAIV